jgi:hypothetical protein
MKKLLLAIALFITLSMNSQSFVKHYNLVIIKDRVNNDQSGVKDTDLSVIFSGDSRGDIIFYFGSGDVKRYIKTGKITQGASKDNLSYRYINTVDEDKNEIILQLFDNGVFRVHTQDVTYEYQEVGN